MPKMILPNDRRAGRNQGSLKVLRHLARQLALPGFLPLCLPPSGHRPATPVIIQGLFPFRRRLDKRRGLIVSGQTLPGLLIRAHIRRIKIKERLRRIPAADDPKGIATLDLRLL